MNNFDRDIAIIQTRETQRIVVRQLPAPGPAGPPGDVPRTLEIELTLTKTFPELFREFIYTPSVTEPTELLVGEVITWDSPARLAQIFTKTFTRDASDVIQTVTSTFVATGERIVKTINRTSRGHIISIDRVHTP